MPDPPRVDAIRVEISVEPLFRLEASRTFPASRPQFLVLVHPIRLDAAAMAERVRSADWAGEGRISRVEVVPAIVPYLALIVDLGEPDCEAAATIGVAGRVAQALAGTVAL